MTSMTTYMQLKMLTILFIQKSVLNNKCNNKSKIISTEVNISIKLNYKLLLKILVLKNIKSKLNWWLYKRIQVPNNINHHTHHLDRRIRTVLQKLKLYRIDDKYVMLLKCHSCLEEKKYLKWAAVSLNFVWTSKTTRMHEMYECHDSQNVP